MPLRSRLTLTILALFLLLAGGLGYFFCRADIAIQRGIADDSLNVQGRLWDKLVTDAAARLDAVSQPLADNDQIPVAVAKGNADSWAEIVAPPNLSQWQIVDPDGEVLYASSGAFLSALPTDAGTRTSGVVPDSQNGFAVAVVRPIYKEGGQVAALLAVASDLSPVLRDFKDLTGADAFLVDPAGRAAAGTDLDLWAKVIDPDFSLAKSRQETVRKDDAFYSVAVLPVRGANTKRIGALVSILDRTAAHDRQARILGDALAFAATVLVVMLLWLTYHLRRSFAPLDAAIRAVWASFGQPGGRRPDEIGRAVRAIDVLLEQSVDRDLAEQGGDRHRRRQDLFLRLQMGRLSQVLPGDVRASLLGHLAANGKTFKILTDSLLDHLDRLTAANAERTRELRALHQAMEDKDQELLQRRDADFARHLQMAALPGAVPPFADRTEFHLHAALFPADRAGGDFYDYFLIDSYHLGFVVGAVSGQGAPAVLFGTVVRTLVKAVAPFSGSPGDCVTLVNTLVATGNADRLSATLFYAILDTRSGEVQFCNASHPPPMIIRDNGQIDSFRDVTGIALGLQDQAGYETGSFHLSPGDAVLVYTDGVIKAADQTHSPFEERRLVDTLKGLVGVHPETVIDRVKDAVGVFAGDSPQADDMTMLALSFQHVSTMDGVPPWASAPMRLELVSPKPIIGIADRVLPDPPAAGDRVDVTIANSLGELERLSAIVDTFVADRGLPSRIAFNVNLSLDELISNMISYGFPDGEGHDILIGLWIEDGHLVAEIVDDGEAYDPFAPVSPPDEGQSGGERPARPGGVFLVNAFMTRTEYRRLDHRNVTTLWLSLGGGA